MAGSSQQIGAEMSSDATPYEQEFQTEVEKEIVCDGAEYDKLKNGETVRLADMHWGRVPFELKLERILEVADEAHKDLILNVACNKRAPDPHWRIRFTVTAQCNIHQHDEWESAEQSMTANRKFNTLTLPLMRMPPGADVAGGCTLRIKIKMSDWAGNFPAPLKSFTERTDITDATLIVEGRQLYVSRAILSIHSTFFHTLFYNRGFADAAKDEFDLPDLSFDAMQTFLGLIYPNVTNDVHATISSMDEIEAMLTLAERFGADSVTRLMEQYLMGEINGAIEGFTLARRLLLADRFRLSAPCSHLMARLRNDDELNRLGEMDEYNELSDAIRGAILDMRLQNRKRAHSDEATSSSHRQTRSDMDDLLLLSDLTTRSFRFPFNVAAPPIRPQAPAPAQPTVVVQHFPAPGSLPSVPPASVPPAPLLQPAAIPQPPQARSSSPSSMMTRYRDIVQRQQAAADAMMAHANAAMGRTDAARAAAAAPPATPAQSWRHLQSDLRSLGRIAHTFAMSSRQTREMDEATRYLRLLIPGEYNAISSARRDALHEAIRDLMDPALHAMISVNVDRFIREVESLRNRVSLSGPERKRARMP